MSDLIKIIESRKNERDKATLEWRAVLAAEHAADSLEGIRQDLTLISGQLVHVVQGLNAIAQKR